MELRFAPADFLHERLREEASLVEERPSEPDGADEGAGQEQVWQRLAGNSPTGAIFYLKNAFKEDYHERQEIDHTSGGKAFVLPSEIITKNALDGAHPGAKGDSA